MKIKLSKSQWEEMGKKAGWMKKAQEAPDMPHEGDFGDVAYRGLKLNIQFGKTIQYNTGNT